MSDIASLQGPDRPRIHPTGLAADFLNRYNEPVMLLDLVPTEPDCLGEFLAWTPCSYVEHFAQSRFSDRAYVLEAYSKAPLGSREALTSVVDEMSVIIVAAQVALRREPEQTETARIAHTAARQLRRLLVTAGAIIHGRRRAEIANLQSDIDLLFAEQMAS